jgi:glutamate synthase domain-containing protein 2
MVGKPCGCRMGAVGGGKRVVHIDIAHFGQFGGEECVVGLFALVKAGVLQQQHIAIVHCGNGVCSLRPDAIGRKANRPPKAVANAFTTGARVSAGSGLPPGRPR